MPFKSERQRAYMHKNHPEIAKRWEAETEKTPTPTPSKRVRKFTDGADPDLMRALKTLEH